MYPTAEALDREYALYLTERALDALVSSDDDGERNVKTCEGCNASVTCDPFDLTEAKTHADICVPLRALVEVRG